MSGPALRLAVELDGDGAHPAAWRRAAHSPDHLLGTLLRDHLGLREPLTHRSTIGRRQAR